MRIRIETSNDFYNARWQHHVPRNGDGNTELRLVLQGEAGEALGSLYLDNDGIADLANLLGEIQHVNRARQQAEPA